MTSQGNVGMKKIIEYGVKWSTHSISLNYDNIFRLSFLPGKKGKVSKANGTLFQGQCYFFLGVVMVTIPVAK